MKYYTVVSSSYYPEDSYYNPAEVTCNVPNLYNALFYNRLEELYYNYSKEEISDMTDEDLVSYLVTDEYTDYIILEVNPDYPGEIRICEDYGKDEEIAAWARETLKTWD